MQHTTLFSFIFSNPSPKTIHQLIKIFFNTCHNFLPIFIWILPRQDQLIKTKANVIYSTALKRMMLLTRHRVGTWKQLTHFLVTLPWRRSKAMCYLPFCRRLWRRQKVAPEMEVQVVGEKLVKKSLFEFVRL